MVGVFLSHNHNDKAFARRLAADLSRLGAHVWLDEAEIRIGDSLMEKISAGINSTDFLAAILSRNSISSGWVNRELEIALNQEIAGKKVKVLPLIVDDCEMPTFLLGKLYADFRKDENYPTELRKLARSIGLAVSDGDDSLPVVAHQRPPLRGAWFIRRARMLVATGILVVAVIAAVAVLETRAPPHGSPTAAAEPAKRWRAQRTFDDWDRSVARYLSVALDFADTFARRGRAAFTSPVAQSEIATLTTRLSAAYHDLDENEPRRIRELRSVMPRQSRIPDDAEELLREVLESVHVAGVLPLNGVIDAINDSEKVALRDEQIEADTSRVTIGAALIQKNVAKATEDLTHLRRDFGTALAELAE
jgi:hypothetical protein